MLGKFKALLGACHPGCIGLWVGERCKRQVSLARAVLHDTLSFTASNWETA